MNLADLVRIAVTVDIRVAAPFEIIEGKAGYPFAGLLAKVFDRRVGGIEISFHGVAVRASLFPRSFWPKGVRALVAGRWAPL